MDNLPEEIFIEIFFNLKSLPPHKLYNLRRINKKFKKIIDELKFNYSIDTLDKKIICNHFNRLSQSNTLENISVFKWLFKNNIFLSDNNILNLVKDDRLDVFTESLKYNENINIIFSKNRYQLLSFGENVKIIKENSPLISAGYENNFNMIKFFLETKGINTNPFFRQLDILIDVLLETKNKKIIKYIITYYYDKMTGKMLTTQKILQSLDDCEDFIFYCVKSKKICINNNFIFICINKNYTELCKYAYNLRDFNILIPGQHIELIMKKNNIDLINFFISKYPGNFSYVLKHLKNIWVSKEFFFNIFNNYLDMINHEYPIIEIYLKYDKDYTNISMLVNKKYIITKACIIESLEISDKRIFKLFSQKY
tara:strand:+ start:9970 stop:11073 length:1104 start_codon:yes stop_codon:yes gene_type:complete